MKKLILLFLCLLAGITLSAQKTIYVIDNETVELFDGSQLKGKTVKEYKITTSGVGRSAITVHAITTSGNLRDFQADTASLSRDILIFQNPPRKVVYVIDGKRHDEATAFNTISPSDIASITVLKDNSPEAKNYGNNVSVIQVRTKKGNHSLLESLKNLPGVKVEADGSLSVNGKPVTAITINGRIYSIGSE